MWTPPEDTSDLFGEPLSNGSFSPMIDGSGLGQHVGLEITSNNWEALFVQALACDYHSRFVDQIPEYPMLSRIDDIYGLHNFSDIEVATLRAECVTVAQNCDHQPAIRTLRKLIYICDAAMKKGTGFRLIGD